MEHTTKNAWRTRWVALCAGAVMGLSATAASAALIDVTLVNVDSFDVLGRPGNVIIDVDLSGGTSVDVDGVGWDVTIEAFNPSWLSEAQVSVRDSGDTELFLIQPGLGDDDPGVESYDSGGINPVGPFTLADGILRLEFFEDFDDLIRLPDAVWNGTLTFRTVEQAVPAPATLLLLATGLGGFWYRRRRGA